jgi:hypothetical protein
MGFQTMVIVRNDCLDDIRNDKEFGRKIYNAVTQGWGRMPVDISSDRSCNAATVIESHHVDGCVLLLACGGTIFKLGHGDKYWSEHPGKTKELQTIADNVLRVYGLKVIKAPKKKGN